MDVRLAEKEYKIKIFFVCLNQTEKKNDSNSQWKRTNSERPQARIKVIDMKGLVTVEFSRKMSIPDHPEQIGNSTFEINSTAYPALLVEV